jgi:hypothetical protein
MYTTSVLDSSNKSFLVLHIDYKIPEFEYQPALLFSVIYAVYLISLTCPALNIVDRCHHCGACNIWMTSLITHNNFVGLLLHYVYSAFQTFHRFRGCMNTALPYAVRIQIRYIGLDSCPTTECSLHILRDIYTKYIAYIYSCWYILESAIFLTIYY